MKKIKCPACYTLMCERNETDIYSTIDVDVSIEKGIVYLICRQCGKVMEMGKSDDIKYLGKPGAKRIF